jgi:hypothetical protein
MTENKIIGSVPNTIAHFGYKPQCMRAIEERYKNPEKPEFDKAYEHLNLIEKSLDPRYKGPTIDRVVEIEKVRTMISLFKDTHYANSVKRDLEYTLKSHNIF